MNHNNLQHFSCSVSFRSSIFYSVFCFGFKTRCFASGSAKLKQWHCPRPLFQCVARKIKPSTRGGWLFTTDSVIGGMLAGGALHGTGAG